MDFVKVTLNLHKVGLSRRVNKGGQGTIHTQGEVRHQSLPAGPIEPDLQMLLVDVKEVDFLTKVGTQKDVATLDVGRAEDSSGCLHEALNRPLALILWILEEMRELGSERDSAQHGLPAEPRLGQQAAGVQNSPRTDGAPRLGMPRAMKDAVEHFDASHLTHRADEDAGNAGTELLDG